MNVDVETARYSYQLTDFIDEQELPPHWFARPDHVAIKAYNADDYERLVDEFRPRAEKLYETFLNERRISTVKLPPRDAIQMELKPPIHLFPRAIKWVELMEARPEDQGDDPIAFDHVEFLFENGVIPIRAALRRRKVPFLEQKNLSHSWLSVVFGNHPDELKFTDQSLESIVEQELQSGTAKIL